MCVLGFPWWGDTGGLQGTWRLGSPVTLSLGQALLFISFLLRPFLLRQLLANTHGDVGVLCQSVFGKSIRLVACSGAFSGVSECNRNVEHESSPSAAPSRQSSRGGLCLVGQGGLEPSVPGPAPSEGLG